MQLSSPPTSLAAQGWRLTKADFVYYWALWPHKFVIRRMICLGCEPLQAQAPKVRLVVRVELFFPSAWDSGDVRAADLEAAKVGVQPAPCKTSFKAQNQARTPKLGFCENHDLGTHRL